MIEDFFQETDLSIRLNGKKFDPASDEETDTTYTKASFAYKVVEVMAHKIDFSGFESLLNRIQEAIHHYEGVRGTT